MLLLLLLTGLPKGARRRMRWRSIQSSWLLLLLRGRRPCGRRICARHP